MAQEFVTLGFDSDPSPAAREPQADERLIAEGWVRRHSADAERAKESVELYRSLGFEVLTRELAATDYDASCRDCVANVCPLHVLIYTRMGTGGKLEGDDKDV